MKTSSGYIDERSWHRCQTFSYRVVGGESTQKANSVSEDRPNSLGLFPPR